MRLDTRGLIVLATLTLGSACTVLDLEYRFDDDSTRFGDASLWDEWYDAVQRTNDEIDAIKACIADEANCDIQMKRIGLLISHGETLKPAQQLQLINRYINRMRRYTEDRRTVKELEDSRLFVSQQWSTLLDFMHKGGDCEDFATAKYALLKLLGYDTHDLRIVVVYDRDVHEYHALIAVKTAPENVALLDIDNRIYSYKPAHYRFVYSINEHSIWDHSLDKTWKPRALRKRQANLEEN